MGLFSQRSAGATPLILLTLTLAAGAQSVPRSGQSPAVPCQNCAPDTQLHTHYPRYVIQRQDVLLISFPLSPELNQTVTVQPDGFVSLQGAQSLHVQGLTVPEMADALKQAYARTLRDPIINVDLQDFQKPLFTVSGQVFKPGQYELRSNITVSQAIAVAGGLQPSAKSQVFLFHRTDQSWYHVEKLDLNTLQKGRLLKEDALLQPGDMIVVPETFITKFKRYVPYSVNAGTYVQPF